VSIAVVSGGTLRAVDAAAGPSPSLGSSGAVLQVPFLPDVLRDAQRRRTGLLDPEYVYDTQPAVRKVVDYLVKMFQRVPLKAYVRESATERVPVEDGDLYDVTRSPMPNTPMSRFLAELLRDRLLWDRWAVMPWRDATDGRLRLRRLPPRMWAPEVDGFGDVVILRFGAGLPIERSKVVMWTGREGGRSPMRAIQDEMMELVESARYREQVFRSTGRFPAWVERPATAPKWSDVAAKNFTDSLANAYAGDGAQAGEIPVFEDGMVMKTGQAFTPADVQVIEGIQLGLIQTCGSFHLAPELIGARQGNYSNMDAFRQGLYAETLGTYYVSFADEFNIQLVPTIGPDPRAYVDFLLEAVLSGSFLEQAAALSTSTGGPWLLRAEARAKQNLPPVDGLDKPIVPLNVIEGGLPSPRGTAPPAGAKAGGVKEPSSAPPMAGRVRDLLADRLSAFFEEQGAAIMRDLGSAKDIAPAITWDAEHWNDRLAGVILTGTPLIANAGAVHVLDRFDPEYDWRDDPMEPWLRAAAAGTAARTNTATHRQVMAAAADPEWRDAIPAVFAARAARAGGMAQSITTEALSFGGQEAAKAVGARMKRWRVTSHNPRTSHAAIDGMTVPIDAVFPIGGRYPGDHTLSPDERAGCTCVLEYVGGVS
jgi:HK97 family phage portal protein